MKHKTKRGVTVTTSTAIAAPATFALPAVETILREFVQEPGAACLALNIHDLHLPFEALVSVPVEAHVGAGESRNEWQLRIRAACNARLYPEFDGTLRLIPAGDNASQLQLDGSYVVPFGPLGRAIDSTVLHGAAQSSLHRFLRNVASRIAALSHWTHLA